MGNAAAGIRLIFWVQARTFINGLTRGEPRTRLKNAGILLLRVVAFSVFYLVIRFGFLGIASQPGVDAGFSKIMLSSMSHALGAILLLGAIKYAYQVFYLSEDLEWLIASPVPTSRVFIAKFIEKWGYSGHIVFSLGWPLCLAH